MAMPEVADQQRIVEGKQDRIKPFLQSVIHREATR